MSSHDAMQMDFFELGDKKALVCANAAAGEVVRMSLRELGFKLHTADTGVSAIERLRYTQYDCIVIQEDFADHTLQTNVALNYLAPLPMANRRNSFVCLIGESVKTLDAMQAFAHSVHVTVNPADLPNLTAILKKGLAEFAAQYTVYNEVLAAGGER